MSSLDPKPVSRPALAGGVVGVLGAIAAYFGAFGFAGPTVSMMCGLVFAGLARFAAYKLRDSRRAVSLPAQMLRPVYDLGIAYFVVGTLVFGSGKHPSSIGWVSERPLDFLALIPKQEGSSEYRARFKEGLPGSMDTMRVSFGALDSEEGGRVTDIDFSPLSKEEDEMGAFSQVRRVQPPPEHDAALVFEGTDSVRELKVDVHAKVTAEDAPELIHVVVALAYGNQDLFWHVSRYFHRRYS